jgi:NADH dehydrogenase [ubiquinone] 1 alpha subcomplex assembly factor 7
VAEGEAGPLAQLLADEIRRGGPISIAEYMALALGHPRHGYYITRDPLGPDGDFTTAPEVSQFFGELIALWCVDLWQRAGSPSPLHLVELGPGRGTLMRDMLRAARVVPEALAAFRIHLVETSPVLRARQEEALRDAACPVAWHDSIVSLPQGSRVVIANEFFDALPVRHYERRNGRWHERLVTLAAEGFAPCLSPVPIADALVPQPLREAPEGAVAETSPASLATMDALAQAIARNGLGALVVDYGHTRPGHGETLQAIRGHDKVSPFAQPGEADLTAHVDFSAMAATAEAAGARVWPVLTQGTFLKRLGIDLRARQLMRHADPKQARDIEAAQARLTAPDAMGQLFKVLALTHPDAPCPAAFETPE